MVKEKLITSYLIGLLGFGCLLGNPANAAEATRAIVEDKLRDKVSILCHAQKLVRLYDSILKRNKD